MLQETPRTIADRFSALFWFVAALGLLQTQAHARYADEPRPLNDPELILASAPEQPPSTNLLGKCVVPQFGKFALRDAHGAIITDGSEFHVFRVEKIDGDRLRLKALRAPLTGWSLHNEVVLVDEPVEPAPPAPVPVSPALRAWAEMPAQITTGKDDEDGSGTHWENSVGLAPRDIAESFKKTFSGKTDVAYDLMIAEFTEVIRANPKAASSYYFRGVARKQRKEYDKAIADFSEAIKLNPRDAQTYCARGTALAEKKRYDQAIADFSEAIKIDPLRADAYYLRGYAHYLKKQYDNALADLTEVIRLTPGSAVAHGVRGWAWEKKGNLDKAIADYTESLQYESRNPGAYIQRGAAYGSKKEYDKAIADFTEALTLNPQEAEAYYFRGLSWCAKEDLDKGLDDINRSIELDPKLTGAHATRGRICYAKKDYAKAVTDFDQAIRRQPQLAILYSSRAESYQRQKSYDKAIADYHEAIAIEPQNPLFLNNLAWLLATCPVAKYRDGKKAIELATRACELTEWKHPGNIDTLAAAYAEAGDFTTATKWQSKAVNLVTDEKEKADYRPRLDLYQAKKPFHDTTS
jgi:tetratricopeptide (TPR) repeat protein